MRKYRRIAGLTPNPLLSFFLTLFIPLSVFTQHTDSAMCKDVKENVINKFTSFDIKREFVYYDNCQYYLASSDIWFSLDVEKYQTEKLSKKEFSNDFDHLVLDESYPEAIFKLQGNKIWTETKGFYKKGDSDHLLMLRYKKINITLISSSYDQLLQVENVLRTIDFSQLSG